MAAARRAPAGRAPTPTACISSASSMCSISRPAAWAISAMSSWNGWRMTSKAARHRPRCCSRTFRCGASIQPGLGHRRRSALDYLKRFGSVTVLNGHIHQIMQKVEGNVTFHTAMSTAFPQPAPGTAPSPGPMKVAMNKRSCRCRCHRRHLQAWTTTA